MVDTPRVRTFPDFSSDRVLHFFKLWDLINFERNDPIYKYDNIESAYVFDENADLQLTILSILYRLGEDYKKLILSERDTVTDFFKTVVDQPAFWSPDHIRLRKFLIDWYSSHRALVTKSKTSIDAYSLTDEELNSLILGFGYPYPYEVQEEQKSLFLHELLGYYKRKGTPKVLGDVLTFSGLFDTVLCEWWLHHDEISKSLWVKSSPVWPKTEKDNKDYYISIPYNQFVSMDPFWHYDKDGGESEEVLLELYKKPENKDDDPDDEYVEKHTKITLPSILPYISLNSNLNDGRVKCQLAILNRKIQEDYEYWIEYVLKWRGAFSSEEDYPEGNVNDVVLNTSTDTHFVFNGRNWVNLKIKLPTDLVEAEKICFDQSEFELRKDIKLNIYPKDPVSLLEAMAGMMYILRSHFALFAARSQSVETWNELLNCSGKNNEIKYVEENQSDAIFYNNSWHNIGAATNFDSTDGSFSLITYIPTDDNDDYYNFSHLEYDGKYAPLDFMYDYMGNGYILNCRDSIDDVNYKKIMEEWENLHKRLADTVDNNISVGYSGEEQVSYNTAWKKRKEVLKIISESFYRDNYDLPDPIRNYELIKNFKIASTIFELFSVTHLWIVQKNQNSYFKMIPEERGFEFFTDLSDEDDPGDISISTLLVELIQPLNQVSGKYELTFDCELHSNNEESSLIIMLVKQIGLSDDNPEIVEISTISQSGSYQFSNIDCTDLSPIMLTFLPNTGNIISGKITNLSFSFVADNSNSEIDSNTLDYIVDNFFDKNAYNFDRNLPDGYNDSFYFLFEISSNANLNVDVSNKEIRFFGENINSDENTGKVMYCPVPSTFNSGVPIAVDYFTEEDCWVSLTFDIETNIGWVNPAVSLECYHLNYLYSNQTGEMIKIENILSIILQNESVIKNKNFIKSQKVCQLINLKTINLLVFEFSYNSPDDVSDLPESWYIKVNNLKVEKIFKSQDNFDLNNRDHHYIFKNSRTFLESLNPQLLDAINAKYFLLGTLYPDNLKKFFQFQESYIRDVGFYFKNNMKLDYLYSLSKFFFGFNMHKELKNIINFLKPYRARFKSFMTEYVLDDPVSDSIHEEDHLYIPRITQKVQDVSITDEQITTSLVMLFEESLWRYRNINKFGYFLDDEPGIYPKVYEGVIRSLWDDFVVKTKLNFYDEVKVDDLLILTVPDTYNSDIGPYNFDKIRAKDYIQHTVLKEEFNDRYIWNNEYTTSFNYPIYSELEKTDTYDLGVFNDGFIECIDPVTGWIYNIIKIQEKPQDFLVFNEIKSGDIDITEDSACFKDGFYELAIPPEEGDTLIPLNTLFEIDENGSIISNSSDSALFYLFHPICIDLESGKEIFPEGLVSGFVKLSIDLEVTINGETEEDFVAIILTDRVLSIVEEDDYGGNSDFVIMGFVGESDHIVISDMFFNAESFTGCDKIIIQLSGDVQIKLNKLELKSVSWREGPNYLISE